MKKTFKKILSVLLMVVVCLISVPIGGFAYQAKAAEYKVGDIIQYGTYPKTRVQNSKLIEELNKTNKTWKNYGRYTKTGSYIDWYKYADFFYEGTKYRAVSLINYYSGYESSNGYSKNITYYFQYAPLYWTVLDTSASLIICNEIIDCRAYQDIVINIDEEYWQDPSKTVYASDYSKSFIRDWLNTDFYHTAFTANQKNNIKFTDIDNEDSKYISSSISDKIFLISYDNADNLLNKNSRDRYGTDYSKCLGLHIMPGNLYGWGVGQSWWWLRTPYNSNETRTVYDDGAGGGSPIRSYYVDNTSIGVVPACRLNELRNDSSVNKNEGFPESYNFEEDSYSFPNYSTKISKEIYINAFGNIKGYLIYNQLKNSFEANKHGTCYGMASTTGVLLKNRKLINNAYNNFGESEQSISSMNILTSFSDFNGLELGEYIKYAFLWQITDECITEKEKNRNDFYGLLNSVKYYVETNDNPVVVDFGTSKEWKHSALAIGYEESDDIVKIYINDSNVFTEKQTLEWNKHTNEWTYGGSYDSTKKLYSSNNGNNFTYTLPVDLIYSLGFVLGKDLYQKNSSQNQAKFCNDSLLVSSNNPIYNENLIKLEGISCGDITNIHNLYWSKNNSLSMVLDKTDTVTVADDNSSITAKIPANKAASFIVDDYSTNKFICDVEENTNVSISFSFSNIIGEVTNISITGVTNDTEIIATQTETGLLVKGLSDGMVTVTKNDEIIITKTITNAESQIEITYDKNGENNNLDVNYEAHKHSYTSVITIPTCIEKGFTTYICSCGDSYIDNYADIIKHTDEDGDNKCDKCETEINNTEKDIFGFLIKLINALTDFFIRILDILGF